MIKNLICDYCGDEFVRPNSHGPIPRYCSNSHRQAAHRIRSEGGHEASLEWFDDYDGLWLTCLCGYETYLGRQPSLREAAQAQRSHLSAVA
jgi:hypothetical protein